MTKLDDYLKINEAAELLGVCRNTLRNWGRAGKIPEYRHPMSNYRLYKVSELQRILKRLEQSRSLPAQSLRKRRPR